MTDALFKVFVIAAFVALSQAKTLDFEPGYNTSEFKVTTSDGYILGLFRISGSTASPPAAGKIPVFLQHGFLSSAADYLVLGPQRALAYLLADAGYDVWLGNCRGNTFSRAHTSLSTESAAFWQYSWHEIGIIDLPAMINFVLAQTGQAKLHYIGHSQGTTAFFVMQSQLPEMRSKVRSMHALAPSAFLSNTESLFFKTFAMFDYSVEKLAPVVGVNEFLANDGILIESARQACVANSSFTMICESILFLMFGGFDSPQLEESLIPKILNNTPAGAAVKQFVHTLQIISSGKFRQFEHGPFGNLAKYGRFTPPEYNLAAVSTPVFLHYAQNDKVAVPKDATTLSTKLGNVKEFRLVNNPDFGHLEFVFGKDVKTLVYDYIIGKLPQY